jgi:hypothetical protein
MEAKWDKLNASLTFLLFFPSLQWVKIFKVDFEPIMLDICVNIIINEMRHV